MGKFFKSAGFANFVDKMIWGHDIKKISKDIGWDEKTTRHYYHGLQAPNSMLYSAEDITNDLRDLKSLHNNYFELQKGLMATKQGSPEETAFLQINQKPLDDNLKALIKKTNELSEKYHTIKNGR